MSFFKKLFGNKDKAIKQDKPFNFKSVPIANYISQDLPSGGATHLVVLFTPPGPPNLEEAMNVVLYTIVSEYGFNPSSKCLVHSIVQQIQSAHDYRILEKLARGNGYLTTQHSTQFVSIDMDVEGINIIAQGMWV